MITLITGGSGSGKSEYAEGEIVRLGERRRVYVATMKPWDEECRRRILRHRAMRAEKGFETVEWYRDLEKLCLDEDCLHSHDCSAMTAVLLECLSNLVSNELFGTGEDGEEINLTEEGGVRVADRVIKGILHLKDIAEEIVIVTNEVFSDGGGYDPSTNLYRQVLGNVNCRIGAVADRVVEVAAGLPNVVMGEC